MVLDRNGQRPRYILPDLESGYVLDPARGFFAVVLPTGADRDNLVANPSLEVDTTGWAAVGGGVARDTTVQHWGLASLRVTPTSSASDGAYYEGVALAAGVSYTASVYVRGHAGTRYQVAVATTGGSVLAAYAFRATGRWQRPWVAYREATGASRRLVLTKAGGADTHAFYLDGAQVEAGALTTYIDGDQQGFVRGRTDYFWLGLPGLSASRRIGQSRAGGLIVPLDQLGFRLLSIVGLGLGGLVNQFTPMAAGGAYYGGTVTADRQFTLVGQIDADDLYGLAQKRQGLIDLFKPDVVTPDQPLVLQYTPRDACGADNGAVQTIACVFEDGLPGRTDNVNSERLALTFRLYLPYTSQDEGNVGAALSTGQTLSANYAFERSGGVWSSLPAFDGPVRAVAYDPITNRVYFGGDFTTVGGLTVNHLCYLDDTGFHAINNGVNNSVYAIAVQSGRVAFGGSFTVADSGGGATQSTQGVIFWSGGLFLSLSHVASTTFSGVFALAGAPDGSLYIGGDFTGYNGVAGADYVARVTTGTWHPLGTGMDGVVYTLAADPSGALLYVAGIFTAGNGVSLNMIGAWDGTTFTPLGSGITDGVGQFDALTFTRSGALAAGGLMNTIGGLPTQVALWNGTSWSIPGGGFPLPSAFIVDSLAAGPDGTLYAGGQIVLPGSHTAVYAQNGGYWQPVDLSLSGISNPTGLALAVKPDNTLFVGVVDSDTATVSSSTALTNTGSAAAGPIITFVGPGKLEQLTQETAGQNIFFNLSLQAGERAVLDLSDPSGITFVSNLRGNVLSGISPGSQEAAFVLLPRANRLALLMDGDGPFAPTGATAAWVTWRNTQHAIDAAAPARLLP